MRPDAHAASTSSAVRANASSPVYRATIWCPASTCSRVALTASSPVSDDGTKTDQNWAPTPPRRRRGMSVCVEVVPAARSSRSKS